MGKEFGEMVCKTLGISPGIVRSVVVEARPQDVLIITLEVRADSEEVLEWAKNEGLRNPTRIVLVGIDVKGEMA